MSRKRRELRILNASQAQPAVELPTIANAQDALEQKLWLASLLRASENLDHWRITETARRPPQHLNSGAHDFEFSYQRADLQVHGPLIYPALSAIPGLDVMEPVYCGSGMSAIATLLTALQHSGDAVRIYTGANCYDETQELMRSLGSGIEIIAHRDGPHVLWLDSSAPAPALPHDGSGAGEADTALVVFDTSCLWRDSGAIRRVAEWSVRNAVLLVLVRSHTKLDSLGIEYGRLGSIVPALPQPISPRDNPAIRYSTLLNQLQQMQRLLGVTPSMASFPPFSAHPDFAGCSADRTAAIIRNTRRMARIFRACLGSEVVTTYHHGLYLTIAVHELGRDAIAPLAADLARALSARGLPIKYAGSFGFDFVAIDRHPAPQRKNDALRIAAGDIPALQAIEIAYSIAKELGRNFHPGRTCDDARPPKQMDIWITSE